jgi:hypothetical protein
MPTARECLAAGVANGRIYVMGGRTHYQGSVLDVVEVYDPATDIWSEHAALPSPVSHHSLSVVDGKLYLIGGSTRAYPPTSISKVEVYDPVVGMELEHLSEGLISVTETFGATWIGQPTPLEITVELAAPLESTELLQNMMLDLSSLGIPSDLPLEHAGEGRYTASTTVTPLWNGHYDLPLRVETTDGERYPFLTVPLGVYVEDEYLYQDQIGERWEVKVPSTGTLDLAASDVVHGGSYAQAITLPSGYIRYTCMDPDGLPTFGYTHLEFWIHPGNSSTENARFGLMTTQGIQYLKLGYHLGITLEPDLWQVVSIPLRGSGSGGYSSEVYPASGCEGILLSG